MRRFEAMLRQCAAFCIVCCVASPFSGGFASVVAADGKGGAGKTLHVPSEYPTIQAAVDAAEDGDTVLVAPGRYREAIVIHETGPISLISERGADETTIDASGLDTCVVLIGGIGGDGVLIRGFTITGGKGYQSMDSRVGGGIAISMSTVAIEACMIEGNSAEVPESWIVGFGGGVVASDSNLTMFDCVVRGNRADAGGGLSVGGGTAHIRECAFVENVGENGGGIYVDLGTPITIIDSDFSDNASSKGGGLVVKGVATIIGCTFHRNFASFHGGGAAVKVSSASFIDCRFTDNSAWDGGGIWLPAGNEVTASYFCGNMPNHVSGGYGGDENIFHDSCMPILGDLNNDGLVDVADLLILLNAWGACGADCSADLNEDAMVNVSDLLILLSNWSRQGGFIAKICAGELEAP